MLNIEALNKSCEGDHRYALLTLITNNVDYYIFLIPVIYIKNDVNVASY